MQSLTHIYRGGDSRADELFDQQWHANAARTDRMFAVLMVLQWLAAIIVACALSPRSWNGTASHIHPHVWLAVFFGGTLASLPVYLVWKKPGHALTRHVIAVAQMMFSSLLIHVSGGRLETHFHVFGSLAFLAFYRDISVLIPATIVVAADHFVRGVYWPATVFGISNSEPWRWIEHSAWVIYEDIFLIMACHHGVKEMWSSAVRTAELEQINLEMRRQTAELEAAYGSKQAIVATALDAVISMDSSGQITGWNPQAECTFGWAEQEVLGKNLADTIIPTSFRAAHQQGLQNFLTTGHSALLNRRIEVTAIHRDGREFPVELAVSPIRCGESVSFCAFVRDITLRLQTAEALHRAKDAAEAASHAKSAFLANMSHEIRTPLNGILGFADLLLSRIDGDPEKRREHLQIIHDSGRHLLTVINDVLDLSKIESGQMQVESMPCSVHEVIAETVSVLRVRAKERGLTLEYFWKSEIPDNIQTDPVRLRQILMNLVGNAIKFTEVGSVQIAARLRASESLFVVDVIDTGIGIDADAVQNIFDPFVQADSSITRRFGGTGLGLSISRRLARLLGGELTVVSEPERGSIFSLRIPTGSLAGVRIAPASDAEIMAAQSKVSSDKPIALPPCRILVVEDGVTNRKLIKLVLEQAGAEVCFAENGRQGVDAACSQRFDLILMDMQMPVMDGYAATRELRAREHATPIIALTAHAMAGDEAKCREAGCSGYLPKPIVAVRLLEAVLNTLGPYHAEPARSVSPDCLSIVSTLPLDDHEFREIVEEFIDRLEAQLSELRSAWEQDDLHQISLIAHWIKGSGGTAGFDVLTEPAARLHQCAIQGPSSGVLQHIEELEALLPRIRLPLAN